MMTQRVVHLAMTLFVTLLVSDLTEKGTAWGQDSALYAQSSTDLPRTVDAERDLRAQFLDEVKREDNLADEKERWFKIYSGLGEVNKEIDKQRQKVEEQIAKAQSHIRNDLLNVQHRLNATKTSHEFLRDLAVKQFALLLKLEKLEEQNQRKGLGRGDYLQEKRMLLDEINRVEQHRFWENVRSDLVDSVRSLQSAIHKTAVEVQNIAGELRIIPSRMK